VHDGLIQGQCDMTEQLSLRIRCVGSPGTSMGTCLSTTFIFFSWRGKGGGGGEGSVKRVQSYEHNFQMHFLIREKWRG
jgi:hypothetical protein